VEEENYGKYDSPKPVAEGDEMDVTIESVGGQGDGIAKVSSFVIFVKGASKGESCKVRISEVKRTYAIGEKLGESSAPAEETAEEAEQPKEEVTSEESSQEEEPKEAESSDEAEEEKAPEAENKPDEQEPKDESSAQKGEDEPKEESCDESSEKKE
jgi:predicted RNA-binding protein with TRAM domain